MLSLLPSSDIVFFQALVARLCEGTGPNANNALAAGVLATVGELAKVVYFFPSCDGSISSGFTYLASDWAQFAESATQ